ncbi:MAG: hypothetical protein Q9164_005060, partial [Protoblastenia rupestris]
LIYGYILSTLIIHFPLNINDTDIIRYIAQPRIPHPFFHYITHPQLQPPRLDRSNDPDASYFLAMDVPRSTTRLWDPDEQPQTQGARLSIMNRWRTLHNIKKRKDLMNGLALLRTCKQVYEEARPKLYLSCTFIFPISALMAYEPVFNSVVHQMQRIELHLDLVHAYTRLYSVEAEKDAYLTFIGLLTILGNVMESNEHCKEVTISFDYREDISFLQYVLHDITAVIQKFKIVNLRFRGVYDNPHFKISSPGMDSIEWCNNLSIIQRRFTLNFVEEMYEHLVAVLSPAVDMYVAEAGWSGWIFRPQEKSYFI